MTGHKALWQGAEDLSVKAWWGWDGEAICIAAEVTDDRHFNTRTGDMIWNGDAIQVALAISTNVHWNVGLALTTNGAAFHQYEGQGDALSKTAQYAVTRDDVARATRYELRLPLATLGLEPGTAFGFNIAFSDDDDGSGMQYWMQLAPGLLGRDSRSLPPAMMYPRWIMAR